MELGLKTLRPLCHLAAALWLALAIAPAQGQSIESALAPGPVIQGHAKFEADCSKCHVKFDRAGQKRVCLDCHKEQAQDVREHKRFHGLLKDDDCRACHLDHKGRTAKIAQFDRDTFDHGRTGFALRDKHQGVKCDSCHKPGAKYRAAPPDCYGCHKKDDDEKGHRGGLGTDCVKCHSEKGWKEIGRFDHEKTKFPIAKGKHKGVKCADCHINREYAKTPTGCGACHKKDDDEKGHKGRYGSKCETCHVDRGWKVIHFDHDRETKYPLKGKHRETKCDDCHSPQKPLYNQNLATQCVSCHKKDDDDKGHKGRYGQKCETCHAETEWKRWTFDHDKSTRYPLRGKHRDTACDKCHTVERGPLYQKTHLDQRCIFCHKKDDKHKGQLGTRCDTCHDEQAWKGIPFDHNKSRFPLTGAHIKVDCKACHKTPAFKDAKMDCYSCHKDPLPDRPKISGDVHKGTLGQFCNSCHNTRSWDSWDFDHDQTSFKLRGKHAKVACADCHTQPMRRTAGKQIPPRLCVNCHVQDDIHRGGFGSRCDRCHVDTDWRTVRPGSGLT